MHYGDNVELSLRLSAGSLTPRPSPSDAEISRLSSSASSTSLVASVAQAPASTADSFSLELGEPGTRAKREEEVLGSPRRSWRCSPFSVYTFVASDRVLSFGSTSESFYCQICLEHQPVAAGYTLAACGHVFCRECVKNYLSSKISDGVVLHLQCPFLPHDDDGVGVDRGCVRDIGVDDIRRVVSPQVFQAFERFKLMHSDRSFCECPSCSTVVLGGSSRSPKLTCPKCALVFCFTHANAHPGLTCRQYERARRADERAAAAALSSCSRPCPGCRTPIMRNGGCNLMTCTRCRVHFCWLCGRSLGKRASTYPRHYSWLNPFGCPGLQMRGGCFERRHRGCVTVAMVLYRLALMPLWTVFLLLVGLLWVFGIGAALLLVIPLTLFAFFAMSVNRLCQEARFWEDVLLMPVYFLVGSFVWPFAMLCGCCVDDD